MCGSIGIKRKGPNSVFAFKTANYTQYGLWGFNKGEVYNARSESLDTVWKGSQYKHGVLYIESFWEKGNQFKRKNRGLFAIAVIYNKKNEFAIVTAPANELVKVYHHRMPLLLRDDQVEEWLSKETSRVINFPEDEVILEAA